MNRLSRPAAHRMEPAAVWALLAACRPVVLQRLSGAQQMTFCPLPAIREALAKVEG